MTFFISERRGPRITRIFANGERDGTADGADYC
jgi:hypothetical protein